MGVQTVGFVGGGRITRILVRPLLVGGVPPATVVVSDPDPQVRPALAALAPRVRIGADNTAAARQDLVFLALHPPVLKKVLPEIATAVHGEAVVVSLAPVLTIAALRDLADSFGRFVRMIPNAPSLLGQGYNPVCYAAELDAADRQRLGTLFDLWGAHPEVPEDALEAYAVLTAMGPTYLWFQLQELRELGERFGLAAPAIDSGLAAMVRGAAAMLLESGLPPAEVLDTIPVHPLRDREASIRAAYQDLLPGLWAKLRPR